MHADRTNRVLIGIFGLLLLIAGAAGIVASTTLFAHDFANRDLLANPAGHFIRVNYRWFWSAVGGVAVVAFVLATRWLIAILRAEPKAGDIDIAAAGDNAHTTLDPAALREALTGEIESYRGVENARVRVLGTAGNPHLVVAVRATGDTDLGELRHRLETEALQHARHALDAPGLPIRLDLSVSNRTGDRVA